ncbi:MAG: hypothetical protein K9G70_07550 [Prolixibacteraceae bacterium]|nr:hypothetical protein [Prolixibacteraceae bacterium]
MNEIAIKYNKLNKTKRQEVSDFLDFLLTRQKNETKIHLTGYKKKILDVSTWTHEDCKKIEENQKTFDQWNIQEW